ncbi:hypothetical protein NL676_022822 [Syzygium grande]|nr:hypothetical protein NL676_022822 [Syzygium grande]
MGCDDGSDVVSLLCQEDEAFLAAHDDDHHPRHECTEPTQFFVFGDEDEYFRKLIRQEARDPAFSLSCCSSSSSAPRSLWLKRARTSAIDWIFDRRESFGFHLHTAYLSITYLDRFLAIRSIADGKLWAVRLLSLACLLLAAKMEEYRVPAISDFQAQDFVFEGEIIQNTELLILKTLEWKLGSITPFSYLHYLVLKFHGQSREREFFFTAMELVLALSKEINLVDYRPSVIAAAAALSSSSDAELSRKAMELKTSRISSWDSQDNEHIFVCYNLIQGIMKQEKLKTPQTISHRDVLRSVSSSLTYASGIKRRLPFDDSDQNCPVKKKTRRQ